MWKCTTNQDSLLLATLQYVVTLSFTIKMQLKSSFSVQNTVAQKLHKIPVFFSSLQTSFDKQFFSE